MQFTYFNPVKIRFGVDYLEAIKGVANRLQGVRFLLVTSKGFSKRGLSDKIANALGTQLVDIVDEITPNPQLKHLLDIKSKLADFDAIIALGGGSVIDSAKFLKSNSSLTQFVAKRRICEGESSKQPSLREIEKSALDRRPALSCTDFSAQPTKQGKAEVSLSNLAQDTRIANNLKDKESHTSHDSQSNNRSNGGVALRCFDAERAKIGLNRPLSEVSYQNNANEYPRTNCHKTQNIPIYAIPTTSGTSSELTHWATIWDNDAFIKHSLSDEILYPKEAIYDPHLTLSLPRKTTIHTALDALSHSFESIWNNNANPISTHYALNAIEIILRDLVDLSRNLDSLPLRTNIMQASIYAGLAFSNTQTALAHALSYPLTMRFGTPHGLACSFSLPLLLDCLPKSSNANALLSPFKKRLLNLFDKLEISTNPKDYGLDSTFIDEIFATLNARAKNGIFDIDSAKKAIVKNL
ncbi:phosphonoacetaldehyde reductase [Helicobacter sp. 23-1044]